MTKFHEWVNVSHKQLSMNIEWVNMSLKKYFQKISSMSKVIFFDRFWWREKIFNDTTKYFFLSSTYPCRIPWLQIITIQMIPMCVISHSRHWIRYQARCIALYITNKILYYFDYIIKTFFIILRGVENVLNFMKILYFPWIDFYSNHTYKKE